MKKVLVVVAAGLLVLAVPACKWFKKAETTEQTMPAPEATPVATTEAPAPAAEVPAPAAEVPAEAK